MVGVCYEGCVKSGKTGEKERETWRLAWSCISSIVRLIRSKRQNWFELGSLRPEGQGCPCSNLHAIGLEMMTLIFVMIINNYFNYFLNISNRRLINFIFKTQSQGKKYK